MYRITIEDKVYACQPEETVLDMLIRENVAIPYACKKGTCHSCMVRSIDIAPPAIAQAGLKDTLKKRQHFLACQCHPEQDMTIRLPDQSEFYTDGTVVVNEMLNRNTLLLVIAFKDAFEFNAGQFVNLQRGWFNPQLFDCEYSTSIQHFGIPYPPFTQRQVQYLVA